jgi:hypothetical protein
VNGTDWTIYAFDRKDHQVKKVSSSALHQEQPSASSRNGIYLPRPALSDQHKLVWIVPSSEDATIMQLYVYDLSNDRLTVIDGEFDQMSIPDISDEFIVWSKANRIFIYSIPENKIIETIETNQLVNYPKVSDNTIVWQEKEANRSTLYAKNILKSNRTKFFSGDVFFSMTLGTIMPHGSQITKFSSTHSSRKKFGPWIQELFQK